MKKLIPVLAALSLFTGSCSKKDYFRSDATILGYDGTFCACCGGYKIKLERDDAADNYKLAKSLPEQLGISPYSYFPIQVEVDYRIIKGECNDKIIEVTRLRLK